MPVGGEARLGKHEVEQGERVKVAGQCLAVGAELFGKMPAHLVLHFLRLEAELLGLLHALGVLDSFAPFGQFRVIGAVDVEMGNVRVLGVEQGNHRIHLFQRIEGAMDGSKVLGDALSQECGFLDFEQLDVVEHLSVGQDTERRTNVVDLMQLVADVGDLGAVGIVPDHGNGGLQQVELPAQHLGIGAEWQVQQVVPPQRGGQLQVLEDELQGRYLFKGILE